MSKRLLAGAAAAALSAAAMVMAGPATSAQAACDNNFISGPNNSSGTLQAAGGAVWHKGPGGNYCTIPSQSGLAYVWCYTTNPSSGQLWYLARDADTSRLGWIWSSYVNSTSGSINHC
ncbi:MAG: hypothetical protein ABI047_17830 [Jatrophihabitantaceae bacterium]